MISKSEFDQLSDAEKYEALRHEIGEIDVRHDFSLLTGDGLKKWRELLALIGFRERPKPTR